MFFLSLAYKNGLVEMFLFTLLGETQQWMFNLCLVRSLRPLIFTNCIFYRTVFLQGEMIMIIVTTLMINNHKNQIHVFEFCQIVPQIINSSSTTLPEFSPSDVSLL